MVGTDSMVCIGSVANTDSKAYTVTDTSFDISFVGKVQDGSALAPVQPEPVHRSSSSMCRPYFPSRVGMLCNTSLHALLTYKIYRKGLLGYLQYFASIGNIHRGVL